MRSALVTAFEYLTGAKGPLRSALDWLRAHGLGERVIKSAVAAVLAWLIAGLLPDNPTPILAPLTAIFVRAAGLVFSFGIATTLTSTLRLIRSHRTEPDPEVSLLAPHARRAVRLLNALTSNDATEARATCKKRGGSGHDR